MIRSQRAQAAATRAEVLALLMEGPCTTAKVAAHLGGSKPAALYHLRALVREGRAAVDETGRAWVWTATSSEQVSGQEGGR